MENLYSLRGICSEPGALAWRAYCTSDGDLEFGNMKQKRPQTHEDSVDNMEQQYGGTEE